MQIPVIETPRLILRAWAPDDAPAWFSILQEPGILRYFPNPNPPERTRADGYIAHHLSHWQQRGYGHWAIVTPDSGRVVGWVGLEYLPELDEVELAYLLSQSVHGRGFATEAARAALQFGFHTVRLREIIGLVHPGNIGSVRVLEKCGMLLADRLTLWGLEMLRYRIRRAAYEAEKTLRN